MSFDRLASQIFPDYDGARPNADELPTDVDGMLDYVACGTGVKKVWLWRFARLVLDGMAGLRCLWFLHGVEGVVEDKSAGGIPPGYQRPIHAAIKARQEEMQEKFFRSPRYTRREDEDGEYYEPVEGQPVLQNTFVDIDWANGTATEVHLFIDGTTRKRPIKLGKWLKKYVVDKELESEAILHRFETRQLPTWHFKISAHPFDVLTMSHHRPWHSCMAPGHAAEKGPLTDMAAGSAVMFFYRHGADVPCGRCILRPGLNSYGGEIIFPGYNVYGCGPSEVDADMLEEVLGDVLEDVEAHDEYLCKLGIRDSALSR